MTFTNEEIKKQFDHIYPALREYNGQWEYNEKEEYEEQFAYESMLKQCLAHNGEIDIVHNAIGDNDQADMDITYNVMRQVMIYTYSGYDTVVVEEKMLIDDMKDLLNMYDFEDFLYGNPLSDDFFSEMYTVKRDPNGQFKDIDTDMDECDRITDYINAIGYREDDDSSFVLVKFNEREGKITA